MEFLAENSMPFSVKNVSRRGWLSDKEYSITLTISSSDESEMSKAKKGLEHNFVNHLSVKKNC